MAALIPDAGELILPEVSHFALLQDPEQFNWALLHFSCGPKRDEAAAIGLARGDEFRANRGQCEVTPLFGLLPGGR
jgi:hypothetical protein